MGLMDLLKKKIDGSSLIERPDDGLPDYETRDRYLKSLRRQHRRIMDEKEKFRLKKIISSHEKSRVSAYFDGKGLLRQGKKVKRTPKKKTFLGKSSHLKKSKFLK